MVAPGGNSTTKWQSHKMRCLPFFRSKEPREVTEHPPKGRLPKSTCLKQTVLGPRLYVVAAKVLW